MESRQPQKAPPSPIKPSPLTIQPQEYLSSPSCSTTASPAESCAGDVEKQLKPWERSASVLEGKRSVAQDADALSSHAEAAGWTAATDAGGCATEQASLVFTGVRFRHTVAIGSVAEANEAARDVADLQRDSEPALKVSVTAPVQLGSASSSEILEGAPNDEANDCRDDDDGPPAITTLLNRIKALQAELKEATDENRQLQSTVHRLEKENARLQTQTAIKGSSGPTESGCDQESSDAEGDEASKDHDESISRLAIAIFGEPSAFQTVMEEGLAVLKNHERCQFKLHELWDTIRTLRTFVETYELERNALRIQRDEAIIDADLKKDNQVLRRKNRALNMRIAKQAAKFIREKNGCSLLQEECESTIDTTLESMTLDDTLLDESDESAVRTGEEILRSMRDRSEILEQRLERLRLARQGLFEGDDSSSEELRTLSSGRLSATSVQ
ncbi:hypothetical protein GQ600_20825 [Phytophthora cactorum]|nr:hypothetical protein GQ600_20825 [Phytophthora cactorum]